MISQSFLTDKRYYNRLIYLSFDSVDAIFRFYLILFCYFLDVVVFVGFVFDEDVAFVLGFYVEGVVEGESVAGEGFVLLVGVWLVRQDEGKVFS